MKKRFTLDGSAELETHLSQVCEQVRAGVVALIPEARLQGLVLAGGYGRGEGGVRRTSAGDAPYNDLEFFVFLRGQTVLNERRYRQALHELGERLTPLAGIEVEFKILSLPQFRRSETSMFYYDLMMGHQWLIGDERLFANCDHHREAKCIPQHEATRLLFNRCSGLLYAKERLKRAPFTDAEADFVGRNIAKAKLALGDVYLTLKGAYHWSCRERQRRLQALQDEWSTQLAPLHLAGVEFKLHPHCERAENKDALAAEHAAVSALAERFWLWVESQRLGGEYRSSGDYAATRGSLCPERSRLRNALSNARAFGLRGLFSPYRTRYPRERLLRSLSLLLWGQMSASERSRIAACLNCGDPSLGAAVSAYETLWHRFN